MHLGKMTAVIRGKRYNTETATLIASDEYWDGHNWERYGTNTHLYRTPKGNYFVVHTTQWQGCVDQIEPIDAARAMELWESLREHECEYEDAFPGANVEIA